MSAGKTPDHHASRLALGGGIAGAALILLGYIIDLRGEEWANKVRVYIILNNSSALHNPASGWISQWMSFIYRRILPPVDYTWTWAYALEISGVFLIVITFLCWFLRRKKTPANDPQ